MRLGVREEEEDTTNFANFSLTPNNADILTQLCTHSNMVLFAYALTLLLESEPSHNTDEDEDENSKRPLRFRPPDQIPKVALMGKGEGSGRGKWKGIFNDIEMFSNLYGGFFNGKNESKFTNKYPVFRGETIEFKNIAKIIEMRELTKFSVCISLVQRHKDKTMEGERKGGEKGGN